MYCFNGQTAQPLEHTTVQIPITSKKIEIEINNTRGPEKKKKKSLEH